MEIRQIDFGSKEYLETLALRDRVMRQPLGLSIYEEDFSNEQTTEIIGGFLEEELIAVGVLKLEKPEACVEYLCVSSTSQKTGIGKKVLQRMEDMAQRFGVGQLALEARVSAQPFYERMGYQTQGVEYSMSHAPVAHIRMKKELIGETDEKH